MTVKEALRLSRETLASSGIEDAPLEAELLLRHVLGVSRAQLYVQLERELPPEKAKALEELLQRRLRREPTAYILGHREFFGLDLYVDPCVLIPRPESELLVEKAIDFISRRFPEGRPCLLADIGTGSGAIAISLAFHLPQAEIYATDISAQALEVALINCQRHGVSERVHLCCGDMLVPLPEPVHLIVANLPYIEDWRWPELSPEIGFEPKVALTGGADGLDRIRHLLSQAKGKLRPGGGLILEIGHSQGERVVRLIQILLPGAKVILARDLGGLERMVAVENERHNPPQADGMRTPSASAYYIDASREWLKTFMPPWLGNASAKKPYWRGTCRRVPPT